MKVVEVTLAAEQADHLVGLQEVHVQFSLARRKTHALFKIGPTEMHAYM